MGIHARPGTNGRNIRSVWSIATHPYAEAHFATFPPTLAARCIKAGTSEKGACSVCGAPRVRVVERSGGTIGTSWHNHEDDLGRGQRGGDARNVAADGWKTYRVEDRGWQPSCPCDAPIVPCVVLDPFGGAGTVSLVAERLGRDSIYIDLSPDYAKMARKRISDDAPMFAAVETS